MIKITSSVILCLFHGALKNGVSLCLAHLFPVILLLKKLIKFFSILCACVQYIT